MAISTVNAVPQGYPYSAICTIQSQWGETIKKGTAAFFAHRFAVTSRRNTFLDGIPSKDIKLISLNLAGKTTEYRVVAVFPPIDAHFEIVKVIEENVFPGESCGYFNLKDPKAKILENYGLHIAGFSNDGAGIVEKVINCKVTPDGLLNYQIDCFNGQFGSPIFFRINETRSHWTLVGIHDSNGPETFGRPLTHKLVVDMAGVVADFGP